jgi:hypothetical protein
MPALTSTGVTPCWPTRRSWLLIGVGSAAGWWIIWTVLAYLVELAAGS